MRCLITHRVEKLSEEDSWELFKRRAFSRGGVLETAKFAAMGRKMVERCGGLPLAIKALEGLLHSKKSEQEWLRIQDSATWDSNDDVLPSLRLSYDNLPHSSLKKCFAYCSILPKDSEIWKDEMVCIWMALGFLLPPKGSNKLMEDIGSEYFNILLWNCLLQDGERNYEGGIYSYKMHDLVHDLALDLSKHHSVTVKADHELNDISKAIYVRVDEGISNIKPPILRRNFEKVQVLYAESRIVRDLVPYPRHLIGLVLKHSYEGELPNSLSNLKYLKYLDISRCYNMNKLPDYIARLYNLQTLSVQSATQLPRNICNLINLRHILVFDSYYNDVESSDMFSGIERLSCLQTLPHFVVSRDHQCVIGQLGSFKNLQGTLRLFALGDVENMEEASKTSLHTKSNIEHLKLVWKKNEDVMGKKEYNHEDVMEGLQPHANLKELTVENFTGKKFATWITIMTNLEFITFRNCKRCEEFPQLGHLPKLRKIFIKGMDNVKVISSHLCGSQGGISGELNENGAEETVATMYPSLTHLYLRNSPKLEEWVDPAMDTSGEDPNNVLAFPKLEVLDIKRCSKLRRIPGSCYPLMKTLHIRDLDSSKLLESLSKKACGLTYLQLQNISGGVGCSSSSSMNCIMGELLENNSVSLKTLSVGKLQGLTYLTLGVGLKSLLVIDLPDLNTINVIKDLSIWGCPNYEVFAQSVSSAIECLTLGGFSEDLDEFPWPLSFSFPNVIELTVWGWEKLKWIVDEEQPDDYLSSIFPSLRELHIHWFQGVKSLPISLAKLPFLERLSIVKCENMESLPNFHDNLQFLWIGGCPIIKERYRKGSGPEWSKIQHIKQIDGLD
ncbi:putative disease resistance protein RGA1 [Daucus carota subsp. sativus]|nr:PREDICTED: putative disease resistance protein RGA1 [Daucus carota subsp. sativus]